MPRDQDARVANRQNRTRGIQYLPGVVEWRGRPFGRLAGGVDSTTTGVFSEFSVSDQPASPSSLSVPSYSGCLPVLPASSRRLVEEHTPATKGYHGRSASTPRTHSEYRAYSDVYRHRSHSAYPRSPSETLAPTVGESFEMHMLGFAPSPWIQPSTATTRHSLPGSQPLHSQRYASPAPTKLSYEVISAHPDHSGHTGAQGSMMYELPRLQISVPAVDVPASHFPPSNPHDNSALQHQFSSHSTTPSQFLLDLPAQAAPNDVRVGVHALSSMLHAYTPRSICPGQTEVSLPFDLEDGHLEDQELPSALRFSPEPVYYHDEHNAYAGRESHDTAAIETAQHIYTGNQQDVCSLGKDVWQYSATANGADVRSLEEVPHMQQAYLTDSTPDGLVFRGAPDPLSDWLAFSNLDDCSIAPNEESTSSMDQLFMSLSTSLSDWSV